MSQNQESNNEELVIPTNPVNSSNDFPPPPNQLDALKNDVSNIRHEENEKSEILQKMESLKESIYLSWLKDLDKVNEIIECHTFLQEIISKCNSIEDIENYFNNNKDFDYFLNHFSKNVIEILLRQNIIYGENGEEKAFEVLLDYINIFIKYILNPKDKYLYKLNPLLEYIKEIFDDSKYFYKQYHIKEKNPNSKKYISYQKYNELFLKKKNEINIDDLKEGDELDVLILSKERYYRNVWSRGKILSKNENEFSVSVLNYQEPITYSNFSFEYALKGTKTLDWDWRINLKEGEIIDCYERRKIYPGTIMKRIEEENKLEYKISFRIFLDSIDINDLEKYKVFWPGKNIEEENDRKYLGDNCFDETILFTSKRLFPKDTKLTSNECDFEEFDDSSYYIDNQVENYYSNGKKTITIGRENNYQYYFNCLLNEFGNLNGFDIMLNFINQYKNEDNKNNNDNGISNNHCDHSIVIMLIFSIFKIALPFLYKPLFVEYSEKLSKTIFEYVKNLSNNDLRNMKKETIDLMIEILKQPSKSGSKRNDNNNYLIETFSLNFAIKMLKTEYLDKRTSAIKSISDIIKIHKYNDEFKQKLIELIKDNNIIYEIYGPNSHIQLVRNSKELIEILLTNNKLSEDELSLIWNATKTGDLDEKKTIIKILNEILSSSFNYNDSNLGLMITKIFNSMMKENSISNDISEEEIELIFSLINKLNDERDIEKYFNYFIEFIKDNNQNNNIKNIIVQIYILSKKNDKLKTNLIKQALEFIKDEKYIQIGYDIITIFLDTSDISMDFDLNTLLLEDDILLNLYKNTFDEYYSNKEKINKNLHENNIKSRIEFLNILIKNKIWDVEKESPIDFVYKNLVLNKYDNNDEKIFYNWLKKLMKEKKSEGIEEKIFKLFTENDTNNNLSIEGFETFLSVFLEINENEGKIMRDEKNKEIQLRESNPKNLKGFPELKKIIFENNNNEIIKRGIDLLNNLYMSNTQNLVDLCIEEIKNSNNNLDIINKCISILSDLMYLNEEKGIGDIIPHLSLIKGTPITVKFQIDLPYNINNQYKEIKTYSNSTFFSLKNQLTQLINYHYDFMKFELINNNENNDKSKNNNKLKDNISLNNNNLINNNNIEISKTQKIELTPHDNGKTISSLNITSSSLINVTSNNREKEIKDIEILDSNNNVTPETIKIFDEWFNKYSTNDKMDALNLSYFVRDVTNTKEDVSVEDIRVKNLMNEKDGNHDGLIEREEFINWYVTAAINKPKLVLENIKAMGYRGDLQKMSVGFFDENKGRDNMLRFILGNNNEFIHVLFNGMNLNKNNIFIFNFVTSLCTNNYIRNFVYSFNNEKCKFFEDDLVKSNIYYFSYICFIVEYFIENANDNDDFKNWIKKFIEENGYKYFIDVFINELKIISSESNCKDNIHFICFGLLIKIIKTIYLCSIESNFENEEFNKFLIKENLVEKINENFNNKEMFFSLMNVIDNCINQKWENNIINEIIQLITYLIPNIEDSSNNDKLIDLIFNGLKSENEDTRKSFEDALIRMSKILISKEKFDIVSKIFEKMLNIFLQKDNQNYTIKNNFCDCFTYLLYLYNENKEKFKLNVDFNIDSFGEKIRNEINDDLTINFKNPKSSNEKLGNNLIILSKLIEISDSIKKEINEKSDLFTNILKKIIFYSEDEEEEKKDSNLIEILTDKIEDIEKNENEKKIEFINLDKIQNFKSRNLSSNITILNSSYNLISILLKNNLKNFLTYLNYQKELSKKNNSNSEIETSKKYNNQYERKKLGYVGLKNLGCICYMNSTMQQFYMIPTLRYTVLKLNDNKKINYVYPEKMKSKNKIDDNMFHQLQKLFSYLLLSEKVDYNPFGFTYSFKDFDGNPTKLFEQKDTQEFLAIFLDRLEQSSKLSEYKHMISNIFGGKNCSLITCLQCGYVSYKYEPSVFLSLEVKNMKNLNESLDKYINEEFIDGYECDGCKKRCRISKRNTLSLLPNVCIIHLQRLYYNWEIDHNEKINSRLQFPKEINLKNYTLENILKDKENKSEDIYFKSDEYYNYYLVGIVVHLGSADSGHYYSYINTIRDGKGNLSDFKPNDDDCLNSWLEFNDSSISKFDISHLEEETFGGSYDNNNDNDNRNVGMLNGRMLNWGREKCKNAYLLIYERLVKSPNMITIVNDDNIDKSNLIEIKENEENKVLKEYDLMRFYNKDNLNEYNNKCEELYKKVFYNVKNNEYFKFEPFYNYNNSRFVPKIYFDEIMNDNKNFEKIKNISESQFTNFNNKIIDLLEEASINNIEEINSENADIIINVFLTFIVSNISNKNNREYLTNGCKKLINLIEKKKELFKDTMLHFLKENTEKIKLLLKYESNDVVKEINDLQEKINLIYEIVPEKNNEEEGTELPSINENNNI